VTKPALRPQRRAASLALPTAKASTATHGGAPATRAAVRTAPVSLSATTDRARNPALAGVALASLAACISDRNEEALKRRIIAAVTTQRECKSHAGTYRFVETKNLNAFLMMIERAPNRPVADRCAELTNALTCLARPARR
jgi:hypothetical protein